MSCPRLKKKKQTSRERERESEKTCKGQKMAKGCTRFQSISLQAKFILIHCSRWIKCNNLPLFAWHLMILGHVWTWWMTMCLLSWGFWSPKIAKTGFPVFPHMICALKKALAWDSCALCSRELDGCSFLLCHLSCGYFSSQPWKSCDFAFAKNCPDGSDFTLNPLNQFFYLKTVFLKLKLSVLLWKKNRGQNTQISLTLRPHDPNLEHWHEFFSHEDLKGKGVRSLKPQLGGTKSPNQTRPKKPEIYSCWRLLKYILFCKLSKKALVLPVYNNVLLMVVLLYCWFFPSANLRLMQVFPASELCNLSYIQSKDVPGQL